jgi:multimeric flavodoxin WrbA
MKIVGVSLGTKNGSNDAMCKEALIAAQEMGAEVSFIHLLDWDIQDCTGCVACSRGLVMVKEISVQEKTNSMISEASSSTLTVFSS